MVADGGRRGYEHMLNVFWDEAEDFGLQLPEILSKVVDGDLG